MQKKALSLFTAILFASQTILPGFAWAKSTPSKENFYLSKDKSEPKVGNIYYSSNKKNELLFKANVWGAVHFPGIHYVSQGTTLIDVISLAGGPIANTTIESVNLSTIENKKSIIRNYEINDTLTGSSEFNPQIKPGDVIFVKPSKRIEQVNLWLSIGTFTTSVIALGLLVNQKK